MKYITLSILLFILISCVTTETNNPNDDANSGMVYGKGHAFFVTAPNGWVLDNVNGVPYGLFATFYPKNKTFNLDELIIYVNVVHRQEIGEISVEEFIQNDNSSIQNKYPSIIIKKGNNIEISNNNSAIIVNYFNDINNYYESVAFIDEERVIVLIVLSCRSIQEHTDSYNSFIEVVKSYFFITKNLYMY